MTTKRKQISIYVNPELLEWIDSRSGPTRSWKVVSALQEAKKVEYQFNSDPRRDWVKYYPVESA